MSLPARAQPLLDRRAAIEQPCRDYGLARLEVFGSAATGQFDPARSGLDFTVTFADDARRTIAGRYFGVADALEALLGRRVDLLTSQPIRNPYSGARSMPAAATCMSARPPAAPG